MKMESLYQEIILDHYKHPHGRGLKDPYSGEAHHVNPTCGDELTVRVQLSADGSVVEELSYEGQGCSISQASASVLHDLVAGQPVMDAMAVGDEFQRMIGGRGTVEPDEEVLGDGVAFAGVAKYPARVKCALLGWMAFKDATARAVAGADASTSTEATR
ncbi:Fe-S cluster assembly sulfur transfer protein SufU [Fodinicola feengrottensis]|uniref:SUF system NifU family Fe-S cluster assembly protein n=1 Tax=Fodinicola feengrottensis TaxID=435914 RepID=A0ABN2IVH5_9ACTN|nr:SUF system NifU family Fe-S cluster assembly protein [Fodinicola feengrottensis]